VAAVTNVAKGVGLEVSSTAPLSESHIGVTGAAAATDDTFTITFAGAAQTAVPAAANIFAGGVKLAAIETINIVRRAGRTPGTR
jgi:hypothetical protein